MSIGPTKVPFDLFAVRLPLPLEDLLVLGEALRFLLAHLFGHHEEVDPK